MASVAIVKASLDPQAYRITTRMTLTGADGSGASAEKKIGVFTGFLRHAHANYDAGQPATGDVTLYTKMNGIDVNLMVLTNINTDGLFTPVAPAHVAASGVAVLADETADYAISQQAFFLCKQALYIKAAQGDAGTIDLEIIISPY